jgi:serine/threonine-protein kinase
MPSPGPAEDLSQQLRQACAELDRRLRAGEACDAEALLAAQPALAGHTDAALELIYTEFVVREQLGQRPDAAAWCARFPQWWQSLEELFQVHRAVGGAGGSAAEATLIDAGAAATAGAAAGSAAAPPGGRRLGPYEILAEIGRGGMGVVYRARHEALKRPVALKMILAGGHAGAQERARFRVEAEAAARLQHPNIVQIHEVGEADGLPYCALEFVEGGSLADRLGGGPLPPREAARLVEALARAMQLAHSRNVVHRDLKPANVLLAPDGTPKITDFGLARQLDSDAGQTQTGVLLGTPSYMAPEQASGQARAAGPAADIYALGAVLYECLAGRPPFRGATVAETLEQVRHREPAPPRALRPAVPRDLDTVCLKCLRKEPERRYASAEALAEDLRRWRAGEPVAARPVGRAERAAKWVRRNPVGAGLVAALVLLVAGGAGWAWWAQRQRQELSDEVARRRQTAETAVMVPLTEARLLRGDAAKLAEALAAATSAAQLARADEVSDELRREAADLVAALRDEAREAERDRRLLAALLDARRPPPGPRPGSESQGLTAGLDGATIDEQFAAAFRAWGLDVDGTPTAEAAARLKGRPVAVVTAAAAALREWAAERRRRRRLGPEWQQPAKLAAALDDDPGSRRAAVSDILSRNNLDRERALGLLSAALRPVPIPFDAGPGEDRGRLRRLAAETDPATEPVLSLLTLVRALEEAGDRALAERLLRRALLARPQEVVLHYALGKALEGWPRPRWAEAVECYVAVRSLRPENGAELAWSLAMSGRGEEALALYERLIADQGDNPWLHCDHGRTLHRLGRYPEAETAYREALRLQRDFPAAHSCLGILLCDHLGRPKEAEAEFRALLTLTPESAGAHCNLGNALSRQRLFAEAETAYQEALRLDPDLAQAHNALGSLRHSQGRYQEAEAKFRTVIALQSDNADAYYNLGNALSGQGRFAEAEVAYRDSLRLQPDLPETLCHVGLALLEQGRFTEALPWLRRGQDLSGKTPGWDRLSAALLRQCERLIELDRLLPVVLAGRARPANAAECGELAALCGRYRRLPVAATRLYAEAFAADPRLAADVRQQQHRYNAACSAALATMGRGDDARLLPDRVTLSLRRQALRWLRADLEFYTKAAQSNDPRAKEAVRQRLLHWQRDADLAPFRDGDAPAGAADDERLAWRRLWDDVAALLKMVGEGK